MASRTAYTSQIPVLPVELSGDFICALTRVSKKFGGRLMSQEALKMYQALPLAWAALSCKEIGAKKGKSTSSRSEREKSHYTRYRVQAADASAKKVIIPGIDYKQQTRPQFFYYTRYRVQAADESPKKVIIPGIEYKQQPRAQQSLVYQV